MYETEENSLVVGKNGELMWLTGKNGEAILETIQPIPNPFEDANDCEDVIRWLGKRGIGVDIYRRPWMEQESVTIYIQGEPIAWKEKRWQGEDWKQGVCELALKVLDNKRELGL